MRYLTIAEIAENCRLSQKTIRRQIAARCLVASRFGNQYRIEQESFEKWSKRGLEPDDLAGPLQLSFFGPPKKIRDLPRRPSGPDLVNWVDISREWARKQWRRRYAFVDLFCGAGGLSLGLELAGFRGVAALDNMPAAALTYARNFRHPIVVGDIRDHAVQDELDRVIAANANKGIDLVCGGIPCQGFSLSGHRLVNDERNVLYRELIRVVKRFTPAVVVMENVTGLRSMLQGMVERKILADFKALGYQVNVTVLNAADYHVPQLRKRVIFIGNRLGLTNRHPRPLLDPSRHLTTAAAIGDLISHPPDEDFSHVPTRHDPEMETRLAAVPEGESLYPNYSDAWKKCPWNDPSCTIKENHGGVNIHPRLPRVLTAREMARLQSFPDDFVFLGSKKWQLVQIGNAVPPLLAKAIGLAVRHMLPER